MELAKADGILPFSELDVQQGVEFYNEVSGIVWKITADEDSYTGVSIINGRYILTAYIADIRRKAVTLASKHIEGMNNEVREIYSDRKNGLTLLEFKVGQKEEEWYKYVELEMPQHIPVGSSLYSLLYTPTCLSPMFFRGQCASPYPSQARQSGDVENKPPGLRYDIPLIQADNIGIAEIVVANKDNEDMDIADTGDDKPKVVDIKSGIGSPVFSANRLLLGIVSFQVGKWSMVIPSSVIQEFITQSGATNPSSRKNTKVKRASKSGKKEKSKRFKTAKRNQT